MNDIEQYLLDHKQTVVDLIKTLCNIPAPSHKEERRAEFCRKWLTDNGAEGVYIDEALNVIYPYQCEAHEQIAVFMAHTDTVFPDTEPMGVEERDGTLYSPGVGDDTANVAVLLMIAKYLAEYQPKVKYGILIAANSCEEGLGNLKGSRALMKAFGSRVMQVVSFDGYYEEICNRAVGSVRYKVEVRTEGGHSYSAFGKKNAIHYLSQMITALYKYQVPDDGSKTTYNVGIVSGGTSVNSIAQQAEMLYEYRSDVKESMAQVESYFRSVVDTYREKDIDISVELIGERPCGNIGKKDHQLVLEKLCFDSIYTRTGNKPSFRAASTDCNISMSLGIPSLTIGLCLGAKAHTLQEWIAIDSLDTGFGIAADLISACYEKEDMQK